MPFVDLPNAHDDYASLWYITNSSTGTVGGFDPSKATVLLLHPQFLDSAWLSAQLEDPRLSTNYNLIAIDARHSGQTTSRLNGKQDSWTDAADLAFALGVRALFFTISLLTGWMADTTWAYRHSVFQLFMFGRVSCSQRRAHCVLPLCEHSLERASMPLFALVADSVLRSWWCAN
jgi:hypothetical protein